ncbi:unnamed protein product, partial [Gulo gulo]
MLLPVQFEIAGRGLGGAPEIKSALRGGCCSVPSLDSLFPEHLLLARTQFPA